MSPKINKPFMQLLAWYQKHPGPLPLIDYLDMYKAEGVVVQTDDFLVLGRPVSIWMDDEQINETMHVPPKPDAWYIFAMAGDLRQVWEALPYELPFICFNRHGQKNLRFYSLPRIREVCGKLIPQQTRRSAVRSPAPEGDQGHVQA